MSPMQYKQALARLGLTSASKAAAAALGVSVRTSQRYASGQTPVPLKVQLHLVRLTGAGGDMDRAIRRLLSEYF